MVGTITILSSEWKFILIPIALVVCILYFDSPWGLETYLPMGGEGRYYGFTQKHN